MHAYPRKKITIKNLSTLLPAMCVCVCVCVWEGGGGGGGGCGAADRGTAALVNHTVRVEYGQRCVAAGHTEF